MAMAEVIETSSAERQSAILTVVLRHHIGAEEGDRTLTLCLEDRDTNHYTTSTN